VSGLLGRATNEHRFAVDEDGPERVNPDTTKGCPASGLSTSLSGMPADNWFGTTTIR